MVILSSWEISSQEIPQSIYDQLESFLEGQEEEADLTLLMDRLAIAYSNPIDINKITQEDLQELRILSTRQIQDLIAHRDAYGELLMLEELQSIESFSLSDIGLLRYFMAVSDTEKLPISINRMFANSRHEVFIKWGQTVEDKKGFKAEEGESPNYLGDKNKAFFRYRGNYENKLRYGAIIEKDEGEQLFSDTINRGLDYITAHAYLKDHSTLVKDVALGDYTISLGQGLIAHNGFGAGKSAWVTDIKKGGRTLRPYNSVNENGFFRGVATTLRILPHTELTLFGSRVSRDGNIRIDTFNNETPDLFFSSLQTAGTHRTLSEKEDKGVVNMQSYGGSLKYLARRFNIAINHLGTKLDQPLIRTDNAANLFRFAGDKLSNTSVDYSFRYSNLHLFGESAYAGTGGTAHLVGALVGLDRRLSLAALYRDYDADYNSITPNAFGESTLVNNEKGLYLGVELNLNRNWKIRTYADVWRNPWLRTRVSNPAAGKEYLVRIDYYVKRKYSLYLQYFFEQKEENEKIDNLDSTLSLADVPKLNVGRLQTRQRLRLHFGNKVSKSLELRNRFEIAYFNDVNGLSKGYMLYQDVLYKPMASSFSMTARFALFDTDNSDSRIFAYENNLLYEFGIPTYSGRGFRYYFNFRYNVVRNLTAEFRIARTYRNRGNNGSGNEEIDGDTRTELKAQLRYSF